ncbi:C40 family peptidase [Paludibacterium purpuratum]|uniref:NlpC/P60 family protein n=1 Tax=Paludibacterium purpuratum TaxID=1144873 RepID=A0A4V3DUH3_9NEIS|nr:C40 family peptidase [Paludibacterium purpuratum]TDR73010.1 NlpC/P60 family protein [Paludibacterium purpuratum]
MMRRLCSTLLILLLAACSSAPPLKQRPRPQAGGQQYQLSHLEAEGAGREILMYTLSLLDVGYQFGGSNPAAGLDCSGMVSYIYLNAVGLKLPHNAAQIANLSRPIDTSSLRVGDLVFFNTLNRPYSHMGIYIGDGKFVHAPHSNSVIRIDRLDNRYFSARFDGARTLFS